MAKISPYDKLMNMADDVSAWMVEGHKPRFRPHNAVHVGDVIQDTVGNTTVYYGVAVFPFRNEVYVRVGCRTLTLDRAFIHWNQVVRHARNGADGVAYTRAADMIRRILPKAERIAKKSGWKFTPSSAAYYPLLSL